MTATFKIAFDGGLQAGFDTDQVTQVLVSRFRMTEDKARMLFAGGRVILKKGLSAAQAQQYVRQLSAAGLQLTALPEQAEAAAAQSRTTPAASGDGFRIVYAGGLIGGHERATVMATARERLKMGDAQVATVFSGRELGVKRGLDEAGARRYLALLRGIGMDVWCDPALPGAAAPTPAPAVQVAPRPARPPAEAPPAVVFAPTQSAPQAPLSEEDAVEEQLKATAFWEDPAAQQNDLDDVDRRLLEAMSADFDLPSAQSFDSDPMPTLEGTDLGNASRHLAETMLNADALHAYGREIAEAEERLRQDETTPLPEEAPRLDRYGAPTAEPAEPDYALQKTIVVVPDRTPKPPPVDTPPAAISEETVQVPLPQVAPLSPSGPLPVADEAAEQPAAAAGA
ncbi:MAG: hypothetical protein KDG55_02275 [Rhodocyclaceae bacterium]|nr:hypothetical protein [Rhodocyclaceae bacterium]